MIYLIFGSDSFRSNEKLVELKKDFSKNSNDLNSIILFDKNNFNLDIVFRSLISTGLFATKNLIIIKNCLENPVTSATADKLIAFLKKTKIEDFDLIFYQNNDIRKNNKIINFVKKSGQIFEFLPISGANLIKWIQQKGRDFGIEIQPDIAQTLVIYLGDDLHRQNNEIKKLADYKVGINSKDSISKEEIQMLVAPQTLPGIFDFIDLVAAKNIEKAIDNLRQLLIAGQAPLYLYSMIVYQFRNLIRVKILLEKNLSQFEIQKDLKIHPFVTQKTVRAAQNFSLEKLKLVMMFLMLQWWHSE